MRRIFYWIKYNQKDAWQIFNGIATLLSIIIVFSTLIEMKKQREAELRPRLMINNQKLTLITRMQLVTRNQDSLLVGIPDYQIAVSEVGWYRTDSAFFEENKPANIIIPYRNVGNGNAINVNIEFHLLVKPLNKYLHEIFYSTLADTIFMNNDFADKTIKVLIDPNNAFSLGDGNASKELSYIVNNSYDQTRDYIELPSYLLELYALGMISRKTTFFPSARLEIHYQDISLNSYHDYYRIDFEPIYNEREVGFEIVGLDIRFNMHDKSWFE